MTYNAIQITDDVETKLEEVEDAAGIGSEKNSTVEFLADFYLENAVLRDAVDNPDLDLTRKGTVDLRESD